MKNSIAKDGLKLSASKMINMTISMAVVMLLSRFRSLEEYGTYSQLLIVLNLATALTSLGLPNSINFFLARAETENEKQLFLSIYYTLSTIIGILTGLLLVLSAPFIIDYFQNSLITNFIYFLAIFPWTKVVLSSIDNILIIYGKTSKVMIFWALNGLFVLLAVIIANVMNMTFNQYLLLYTIIEVLFTLITYIIVNRVSGHISINFNIKLVKTVLIFSVPIGLASITSKINILLDKIIISRYFSVEQVAIYTNAAKELPVTIIASALTAVLLPRLVYLIKQKKNDEAIILWGDTVILSFILLVFASASLIVFGEEVITILYSKKYIAGSLVFKIYSLIIIFRVTYFGIILNSIGKTKFILYSSLLSLILNIVLNIIGYYFFGFIGPAIATFISLGIVASFQLIATSNALTIQFKNILPWKELFYILIINILMGLTFYRLKLVLQLDLYLGDIGEALFLGFIWTMVYFAISYKKIKMLWFKLSN